MDNKYNLYIHDQLRKDNNNLDLSSYSIENWDRAYILTPYIYEKMYDQNLKKYSDIIRETSIEDNEDICVIALFNKNKLIRILKLNRMDIDLSNLKNFSANNKIKCYLKKEMHFIYNKKGKTFILYKLKN